jgi:hypothetical protein
LIKDLRLEKLFKPQVNIFSISATKYLNYWFQTYLSKSRVRNLFQEQKGCLAMDLKTFQTNHTNWISLTVQTNKKDRERRIRHCL